MINLIVNVLHTLYLLNISEHACLLLQWWSITATLTARVIVSVAWSYGLYGFQYITDT